jgi:hypothetical protein
VSCVTGGPGSGRRHSAVPDSPQLTRRVGERWAPLAGVGGQPGGRHLASGPPPDGHWACANALAGALGGRWQRRWRWTTEDRWSVGALDYGRPLERWSVGLRKTVGDRAPSPSPFPPPFLLSSSPSPSSLSLPSRRRSRAGGAGEFFGPLALPVGRWEPNRERWRVRWRPDWGRWRALAPDQVTRALGRWTPLEPRAVAPGVLGLSWAWV